MEFTYSEEFEVQKKKSGRKQRARKKLMTMTAIGLTAGLVVGICLGSMGKKDLKAEVASLTDQVIEKEKQVSAVRKEMYEIKNREAIDTGEKELPWNLVLVNPWNEMEEGYEPPELEEIEPDMFVDSRIAEPLRKMLADADAEGLDPFICSAYRSIERQEDLFNQGMKLRLNSGLGYYDAFTKTASVIAVPGTSEHALGLAVDIISVSNTNLDETQEETAEFKWFEEHCYDYGFILRYPNGTTEITGIIYEPWHYRYVGIEIAQEIKELGVTFEEYMQNHYLK